MEAEKCQIFKTFYVTIFVVKSIRFNYYYVSCALIHVSISFPFHLTKICTFPFQFQFQLTNITLLYAHSVCDTIALLQLHLPHVALYKCYAFTFAVTFYTFIYCRSVLELHELPQVLQQVSLHS